MSQELPYDLHRLPPSAELVYRVLQEIEPATPTEVTESTCSPYTTIGEALRRLHAEGLVCRQPHPQRPNEWLYETEY